VEQLPLQAKWSAFAVEQPQLAGEREERLNRPLHGSVIVHVREPRLAERGRRGGLQI
jgi:hypothetical protein